MQKLHVHITHLLQFESSLHSRSICHLLRESSVFRRRLLLLLHSQTDLRRGLWGGASFRNGRKPEKAAESAQGCRRAEAPQERLAERSHITTDVAQGFWLQIVSAATINSHLCYWLLVYNLSEVETDLLKVHAVWTIRPSGTMCIHLHNAVFITAFAFMIKIIMMSHCAIDSESRH